MSQCPPVVDVNGEHMDDCRGGGSAHKGWMEVGRKGRRQVGGRWQVGSKWAGGRWKAGSKQAGGGQQVGGAGGRKHRKWTGSRQGRRQEVGRKWAGGTCFL